MEGLAVIFQENRGMVFISLNLWIVRTFWMGPTRILFWGLFTNSIGINTNRNQNYSCMKSMCSLTYLRTEVLMCDTAALCPIGIIETEPKFYLRWSYLDSSKRRRLQYANLKIDLFDLLLALKWQVSVFRGKACKLVNLPGEIFPECWSLLDSIAYCSPNKCHHM